MTNPDVAKELDRLRAGIRVVPEWHQAGAVHAVTLQTIAVLLAAAEENARLRAALTRMRREVAFAVEYAGGRWEEWGDRACDVADMLNEEIDAAAQALGGRDG